MSAQQHSGWEQVTRIGSLVWDSGALFYTGRAEGRRAGDQVSRDYGPTWNPGTTDLWEPLSGKRVGVGFTAWDNNLADEQTLTARKVGVETAPLAFLTPGAPRVNAGVHQETQIQFTSWSNFQSTAWGALSPDPNDTVYHVRVRARRYLVSDKTALANALSGAQGSGWVDKLTNAGQQLGWVYVEFLPPVNGVLRRIVHQFSSVGQALPAAYGPTDIVAAESMTLSSLINNYVSNGMRYSVAAVEAKVVLSANEVTGAPPALPPAPSAGVQNED